MAIIPEEITLARCTRQVVAVIGKGANRKTNLLDSVASWETAAGGNRWR